MQHRADTPHAHNAHEAKTLEGSGIDQTARTRTQPQPQLQPQTADQASKHHAGKAYPNEFIDQSDWVDSIKKGSQSLSRA